MRNARFALGAAVLLAACTTSPAATPSGPSGSASAASSATAEPTAEPSATNTVAPVTSPTLTPTPEPASASGFSVAEAFGRPQRMSEVIGVIHWNGRFVAVSVSREAVTDATEILLWSSSDGRDWSSTPVTLADGPVQLADLVPIGDDTVLLLGAVLEQGAQGVWRGATWTSRDLEQWRMTDFGLSDEAADGVPRMVHGPKGYLAASGGALWFSSDGVSWERSAEPAGAIAAGDDGFVATGGSAWRASADGRTWYDGDALPTGPLALASVGGGEWMAVGGESEMNVWVSDNGLSWSEATSIRELSGLSSGPGIDTEVTHTPLVTVGDEVYMTLAWQHCCVQLSGGRGVYRSSDGTEWSSVGLDESVVQTGATDGNVVVLGGQRSRGAEAVLWVSD